MDNLKKYYRQIGRHAAILENKEYFKTDSGQVLKIKNAPKHENRVLKVNGKNKKVPFGKGGVVIPNVESAVSATHENRNSKNKLYTYKDEEIKIMPKEVKAISAALALPIKLQKKAISPSKFLDLLLEKKDNTLKKYKDPINPRISPERFSAIKSNQSVLASLPSTEDLYDFVFDLQESKKSGNLEDIFAQTGKGYLKTKLSNYPYMKGSRPVLSTSNGKSIEVLDGRTISMDQIYDSDSVIVKGNEGKTFYKSKLKKYIR